MLRCPCPPSHASQSGCGGQIAEMRQKGSGGASTVAWRHGSRDDGTRGGSPLLHALTCKRLRSWRDSKKQVAPAAAAAIIRFVCAASMALATCASRQLRKKARTFACIRLRGAQSPPFQPIRRAPPDPVANSHASHEGQSARAVQGQRCSRNNSPQPEFARSSFCFFS